MASSSIQNLFDCLLVLDLCPNQSAPGGVEPQVRFRYPHASGGKGSSSVNSMEKSIVQFCFPDTKSFPRSRFAAETFSFVLTESDGDKRYGYCRRILQPGTGRRYPRCFCLLSFLPCFGIFSQILDEVEKRSSVKFQAIEYFVEAILTQKLPLPGGSITVSVCSWDKPGQVDDFCFHRPNDNDSLFDYITFRTLLKKLDPTNLLHLFASILAERRIIFMSARLSVLSDCTNAAIATISPFEWQHIFIPVLPPALLSYCCAPMPFVVGILKSSFEEMCSLPMEEVTLVNLDENSVQVMSANPSQAESIGDRTVLSTPNLIPLQQKLEEFHRLAHKKKSFSKAQSQQLAAAFMRFIVSQTHHYSNHVLPAGNTVELDKPAFIAGGAPEARPLLTLIAGSQMFERFVAEEHKRALETPIKSPYEQVRAFYNAEKTSEANMLLNGGIPTSPGSQATESVGAGLINNICGRLGKIEAKLHSALPASAAAGNHNDSSSTKAEKSSSHPNIADFFASKDPSKRPSSINVVVPHGKRVNAVPRRSNTLDTPGRPASSRGCIRPRGGSHLNPRMRGSPGREGPRPQSVPRNQALVPISGRGGNMGGQVRGASKRGRGQASPGRGAPHNPLRNSHGNAMDSHKLMLPPRTRPDRPQSLPRPLPHVNHMDNGMKSVKNRGSSNSRGSRPLPAISPRGRGNQAGNHQVRGSPRGRGNVGYPSRGSPRGRNISGGNQARGSFRGRGSPRSPQPPLPPRRI